MLDPNSGKVSSVGSFYLAFLAFFPLGSCLLSCFVLLVEDNILLRRDLELDRLFIVNPPTIRTSAFFIGVLEAVETELTYLITAGTGFEILVCKVEFLNAKGTATLRLAEREK